LLKAVIFDLDGVIVKFNLNSRRIKEEMIAELEASGIPKGKLSAEKPFSIMKEAIVRHLSAIGKEGMAGALITKAERIQIEHEVVAARETELISGAKQMLGFIKGKGLKVALFTYNNSRAAEIALSRHGVEGYFDLIVARDMVPKPKPNPAHLTVILDKLGIQRGEAIVVGDSEMDIIPSKALGVKVVALTTGMRRSEELSRLDPDYMIQDMRSLEGIVERLTGGGI